MALAPSVMQATMLARAIAAGLFDRPPIFGLSRVYGAIANGVVQTVHTPAKTLVTVTYTGQPITPGVFGHALATGLSGMDPDKFRDRTLLASLFVGPASVPFFQGIAGVVAYFQPTATLVDLFAPIGSSGHGVLAPGGIVFNAAACFDNMHSAAKDAKVMVVQTDVHLGGNPSAKIADPITQEPLGKGDLFSLPRQLLLAIATQLQVELAKASQIAIPVAGAFLPPPVPPGVTPTLTTIIL